MVDIQSATVENRRGRKKKEERRQKPQLQNIMACPVESHNWLTYGDKKQ